MWNRASCLVIEKCCIWRLRLLLVLMSELSSTKLLKNSELRLSTVTWEPRRESADSSLYVRSYFLSTSSLKVLVLFFVQSRKRRSSSRVVKTPGIKMIVARSYCYIIELSLFRSAAIQHTVVGISCWITSSLTLKHF